MVAIWSPNCKFIEKRRKEFATRMSCVALPNFIKHLCFLTVLRSIRCEDFQRYISVCDAISSQSNSRERAISKFVNYAIATLMIYIVQKNGVIAARAIRFKVLNVLLPTVKRPQRAYMSGTHGPDNSLGKRGGKSEMLS